MAHERQWEHAADLRAEIAAVRRTLASLARTLQAVAGVGDLIDLPASRDRHACRGHPGMVDRAD